MSSRSPMAHTAWTECGNSATPPSLWQNTGATASCRRSSGSPSRCSGASCLHASPSATSGLWSPASRAAWLSRSASAASTRSASRPSATPSSKPWARSSAACALHCAKKSRNSRSRVDRTIRRSAASFYTPQDLLQLLASSLVLAPFIKRCSPPSYRAHMPSVPSLPPEGPWQVQHGSVTAPALPEGSVLLSERGGPRAMTWGSAWPHSP